MACAGDQSNSDAQQIQGLQKSLRGHPLFFGITMGLLSEIINSRYVFLLDAHLYLALWRKLASINTSIEWCVGEIVIFNFFGQKSDYIFLYRLFTTVRDSLGLTYDVSFELNLFDRLKLGWYVISVTSTPSKVWAPFL